MLPNGNQGFLYTLGGELACETGEDERNRFITCLAKHLGDYSYLKEEVIAILTSLKYVTKLHKISILTQIKHIISHRLKTEGKNRREKLDIRSELFDILNLHGYLVETFPTKMDFQTFFRVNKYH